MATARTPRGHHVVVEQGRETRPHDRARLDRLDPEVKGEHEEEDGDRLVVVAAGDRARDVAGRNGDEERRPKARPLAATLLADLLGEEVGRERGQAREGRRELDADLADVDGDREHVQNLPDEAARDHEAGVQGSADDAAERVPCCRVEPVPEGLSVASEVSGFPTRRRLGTHVEAFLRQHLCRAEVEPRVESAVQPGQPGRTRARVSCSALVDDRLEADDGELA